MRLTGRHAAGMRRPDTARAAPSLHLDATVQLAAPTPLLDPPAELAGLLAHFRAGVADLEGVKLGQHRRIKTTV
jgi:hypothetical protein